VYHHVQTVPLQLIAQAVSQTTPLITRPIYAQAVLLEHTLTVELLQTAQVSYIHILFCSIHFLLDCPQLCATCTAAQTCQTCQLNAYLLASTCQQCPNGTYSTGGNSTSCPSNNIIFCSLVLIHALRLPFTMCNMYF
jgi:hypothetical protein